MRCPPNPAAALLALALLAAMPLLAASATAKDDPAPPTIYKWVDENGIAHYTTDRSRIPPGLRDRFELPDEPPTRPARPATQPAARVEPEAAPAPGPPPTPAADPVLPPRAAPRAPEATAPELTPPPAPSAATRPGPEPTAPLPSRSTPAPTPPAVPRAPDASAAVAERDLGAERDFLAVDPAPDLDARIRSLEAEIQADEEALKALLAAPSDDDAPLAVADDPDLRAIADRLPERLGELDTLRAERGPDVSP